MARRSIYGLLIILLLTMITGGRGWSAPLPGFIENKATVIYGASNGTLYNSTSNVVNTPVSHTVSINLTPNPGTIVANGYDVSVLTARVTDKLGTPLPKGTLVTFVTDKGTFSNGETTITVPVANGDGEAQTSLVAPILAASDTAHLYAFIGISASNGVELIVLPGAAAITVYDFANKKIITASDDQYLVQVLVTYKDSGGNAHTAKVDVDSYGVYVVPDLNSSGGFYEVSTVVTERATGEAVITTPPQEIQVVAGALTVPPENAIQGALKDMAQPGMAIPGVKVDLYNAQGVLVASTITDENSNYMFDNVQPGDYFITVTSADGRNATVQTPTVFEKSGVVLVDADLLIDPYGVVYDSDTGNPLESVTVWILNPDGSPATLPDPSIVPGAVNTNPLVTGPNGTYQWPLIAPGNYMLGVIPTAGFDYAFPSSNPSPYHPLQVGSKGEVFAVVLEAVNINVPLDPPMPSLFITKTANKVTVEIGDFLSYRVELQNTGRAVVLGTKIVDTLPVSFHLVEGSSRLDGKPLEPIGQGVLTWDIGTMQALQRVVLTYKVRIGIEPLQKSVNSVHASGLSAGRSVVSNVSSAAVKVTKGIFAPESLVFGRVYWDKDENGEITDADIGMPNIRIYLEDGTSVITDSEGKYSIYGVRKGTRVLKLDCTTLPAGLVPSAEGSRFAGYGDTRFVDIKEGEPIKANFPLRGKKADEDRTYCTGETVKERIEEKHEGPAPTAANPSGEAGTEEILSAADNKFEIIGPADKETVLTGKATITVKGPLALAPSVFVNDVKVDDSKIGEKAIEKEKKIFLYKYISVELKEGLNIVKAVGKDEFGNERAKSEVSLIVPGRVNKIVLQTETKENVADGKSLTSIGVMILDKDGNRVSGMVPFDVDITVGKVKQDDVNPDLPGIQVMSENGDARFDVVSPENAGDGEITVSAGDVSEKTGIIFLPHLREMILVGVGEGVIGWNNISGNVSRAEAGDNYDDGYYIDGRLAFFLKGKVLGKYLLTAAYDSGKDEDERLFRDLDPNNYYPVYGDESQLNREAQSTRQFYVKVEKGRNFVLFGDFNTDLKEKELTAYNRTFNGIKGKIQEEKVSALFFATKTDQSRIIDEIPALGISGYYQLSRLPVVEGSEKVTIITRDRIHNDRIVESRGMARYSDYDVNYSEGTLLFRLPVSGYDAGFNPVFIRVEYESISSDIENYIFGGTADYRPVKWLTVGATHVTEENEIKDYIMQGVNASVNITNGTTLSAEAARTDSIDLGEGQAFKAEVKSKATEKTEGKLYYIKVDGDYSNPFSLYSRGLEKYGFEGKYKLNDTAEVFAEAYNEDDNLSDARGRKYAAGYRKKKDRYSFELQAGRFEYADFVIDEDVSSNALKGKLQALATKTTTLSVETTKDVSELERHETAFGVDQKINDRTSVYAKYKFGELYTERLNPSSVGSSNAFLAGVSSNIYRETTLYSEYMIENSIGGREDHSKIGLKNRWVLGKGIIAHGFYERVDTINYSASSIGNRDYHATGLSLEYLPKKNVKSTTKYELRVADTETSHLFTQGVGWKVRKNISLLGSEKLFSSKGKGGLGDRLRAETVLGLAYRPVSHDGLNMFFKYTNKYIKDETVAPETEASINIASIEGVERINKKTELSMKYALKKVNEEEDGRNDSTYTDLVVAKVTRDLAERWDVGLVGRAMHQYESDEVLYSSAVEVGYKVEKNLWVSVGYNFKDLGDDKYPDAEYTRHGVYLSMKLKFDEKFIGEGCKEDSDGDGVFDPEDKCPNTPACVKVDCTGCPLDSDFDGVDDYLDRCPNTPIGVKVDKHGCPLDSDGDGVLDYLDKCPNTPPGVKVDAVGCTPDSDKDGIPDYLDKCPGTPIGVAVDAFGCPPDTDLDGVLDYLDLCPGTPPGIPVNVVGCTPDTDLDGVFDYLDKCPDTPSGVPVDEAGCPLDSDADTVINPLDNCPNTPKGWRVDEHGCEVAIVLNVKFDTDKAAIKGAYFADIEAFAKFMNEHPEAKAEIQGHTDSIGSDKHNMRLSDSRANAVMDTLIGKYGVSRDRLSAKGYGKIKPVASNETEEGRAINRRIEAVITK